MEDSVGADTFDDFRRNPECERRVVVFCDVLGWRNHILAADSDPEKLGVLRRMILRQSRSLRMKGDLQLRATSFSDNIVISQPLTARPHQLVEQIALFQIAGALGGFLLRGG